MVDKIIETNADSLEDAIEIAKMTLEEGDELFIISSDSSGNDLLIPLEVEKKNAN